MEIWFWFAVAAAVLGGIPSFMMKMAAHRDYNSGLFILYGASVGIVTMIPGAWLISGAASLDLPMLAIVVLAGMMAALSGIFRINALKYIDTTIYYPLVKLLSPALAIVFGIVFFAESFTSSEWIGLLLSLFVPLLLISRIESTRQKNLIQGLVLVLVTGFLSAVVAGIHKYVTDSYGDVVWMVAAASLGVFIGSVLFVMYKQGIQSTLAHIRGDTTKDLLGLALLRGVFMVVSFGATLYAFALGGTLAVVHTIHSLYILIPIVLSIIFYKEHWNAQKAAAIVLSVAALALLG